MNDILRIGICVCLVCAATSACTPEGDDDAVLVISLAALIVNAPEFADMRARTVGYVSDSGYEIYLTSEHARVGDFASSVILETELSTEHCPERISQIEGIFSWGYEGWTLVADRISAFVPRDDGEHWGFICDGL